MAKAPKKKPAVKPVPEKPSADAPKTTDEALESFLNRSQEPEKETPPPKKRRLSRGAIALIAAIAAVAILICVIVVIVNQPITPGADEILPDKPAELATTVDEKGEHHIEVGTDSEGEIRQNGYGELVSYTPAQIVKIEVENTAGSFVVNAETPEGEATVYTVTGFEGYDLQPGMADAVANDAASVTFSSVAAVDGNLADFGLEKPRATVRVSYTDNTTATILVGSDADGGAGTYATLGGSKDVFLVSSDSVDAFLYSVLDLISAEITPSATSVDDNVFSVIELSGTHYPDPITIVPNDDEAIKSSYRLTSPYEMFADNYEGTDVSGSIRGLYAESVVSVNPSGSQLSSYGLSDPYAQVRAVYPDTQINLACSSPTENGLVNLYNPDKGIVYTIRLDALGWANTDLDLLLPKTVIELNLACVNAIDVTSDSKDYALTVDYNTKSTTNEQGDTEQSVEIKASLDGKRIPTDSFRIFFQNFNAMTNLGNVSESGTNIVYQWHVSYSSGRADDTIAIYDTGDKACPVALNGILIGSVSKSHVSSLQQDILDLKNNKIPNSL